MPGSPAYQCLGRGPRRGCCPNKVFKKGGLCLMCQVYEKKANRDYDRNRDTGDVSRAWLHSRRWGRVRDGVLKENPLCAMCERLGRVTPAYLVHHIRPHEGNYQLFWDVNNLESLCNACHEAIHGGERWGKNE